MNVLVLFLVLVVVIVALFLLLLVLLLLLSLPKTLNPKQICPPSIMPVVLWQRPAICSDNATVTRRITFTQFRAATFKAQGFDNRVRCSCEGFQAWGVLLGRCSVRTMCSFGQRLRCKCMLQRQHWFKTLASNCCFCRFLVLVLARIPPGLALLTQLSRRLSMPR